ncbi:CRISPR-associated protein Cas1, partial [Pasteurella multocida subsp. multocida str. Anand1_buffalo]
MRKITLTHTLIMAYTVLRSAIARAFSIIRLVPQLGIFHRSEVNPFNLADDFVEPFRPLVDFDGMATMAYKPTHFRIIAKYQTKTYQLATSSNVISRRNFQCTRGNRSNSW